MHKMNTRFWSIRDFFSAFFRHAACIAHQTGPHLLSTSAWLVELGVECPCHRHNILALFSHLLLSQKILKFSFVVSNSTIFHQGCHILALDKHPLMIAGKVVKRDILRNGKHSKYYAKRDVPSIAFVSVFNIFTFHSHFPIIPRYHAKYV